MTTETARPAPPQSFTRSNAVVGLMMVAFGVALFAFQFLRYRTFKSQIHDLGLISQTLWNTLQGDWFLNSINPEIGYGANYLGNHFSPALAAWLPAFALCPSPVTLLLCQAVGLAVGAWPLWLLLRDELPRGAALALVAVYLLQPALWFAGLYDFHHETIAATLGLWIWWCHVNDRVKPMLALLVFTAMLKEHLPLLTGAFGLYLLLSRARPRLGLAIGVASVAYFGVVMGKLVPYFNETQAHSYFARRFPHLGNNAREALVTCLRHPLDVLFFMNTPRHHLYVRGLLGAWAFLPLLAPGLLLVALPVLFVNMQSAIPISYDIAFYHADSVVPWISLCACAGFVKLTRISKVFRRHATLCALVVLVNAVLHHATTESAFLPLVKLPLSPGVVRADYQLTPHHLNVDRIHALVPWDASVSVQTNLACFFVDRRNVYPFPSRSLTADYVVLDLTETYRYRDPEFRKFWLEWERQATVPKYCAAVRELLSSRDHQVVALDDGYVVVARKAVGLGASSRRDFPSNITAREELQARCGDWEKLTGRGYGR